MCLYGTFFFTFLIGPLGHVGVRVGGILRRKKIFWDPQGVSVSINMSVELVRGETWQKAHGRPDEEEKSPVIHLNVPQDVLTHCDEDTPSSESHLCGAVRDGSSPGTERQVLLQRRCHLYQAWFSKKLILFHLELLCTWTHLSGLYRWRRISGCSDDVAGWNV